MYSTFTNSPRGGRKVPALALGVVAALALAGVVISNGVNQSKTVTPTDLKSKSGDDWDDSASKARTNTIAFKQSDCDPSVAAGSPLDIVRRFKVVKPKGWKEGELLPMLLDIHGYYMTVDTEFGWTRLDEYQDREAANFLIVVPEGSADMCIPNAAGDACVVETDPNSDFFMPGWNVVGFSADEPATGEDSCEPSSSYCASWHCQYPCYASQVAARGDSCIFAADTDTGKFAAYASNCATQSALDDTAYMAEVIKRVVGNFGGDPDRIYAHGQSMGGLATIHFGKHLSSYPGGYSFAAIAPCSAAAARGATPKYDAPIPTFQMHGTKDETIPPMHFESSSAQVQIHPPRPCHNWNTPRFVKDVVEEVEKNWQPKQLPALGGDVAPAEATRFGLHLCSAHDPADADATTCLSNDGYYYDPIDTTIRGLQGPTAPKTAKTVASYFEAGFHEYQYDEAVLRCTYYNETSVPQRICLFEGKHYFPFMTMRASYEDDYAPVKLFYDIIWKEFLRGGKATRKDYFAE
mmetsp:Transcript_27748/g.83182  ORF Transcript_27748/g.83182 Transcript_27748/m.83182 type:complete len:521 (-) Transcript_27748:690-2252(-)